MDTTGGDLEMPHLEPMVNIQKLPEAPFLDQVSFVSHSRQSDEDFFFVFVASIS